MQTAQVYEVELFAPLTPAEQRALTPAVVVKITDSRVTNFVAGAYCSIIGTRFGAESAVLTVVKH
jgi:hypothetical protein